MVLTVSVIIPAYNSAATIERAISSVLFQTYTPLEIIVVDDGSSDNTVAIVKQSFPSVNLLMQKNAGAARARNQGVGAAAGDLVAFLDADDVWHPQKIEKQLEVFSRAGEIDLLCTRCLHYKEVDWSEDILLSLEIYSDAPFEPIPFGEVFKMPYLATPSVMIKRDFFLSLGGFDQSLETAEDVDLWLRSARKGYCARLNLPVTLVITQVESLSTRTKVSPYDRHLYVIDRLCESGGFSLLFIWWVLPRTKSDIYCKWGSTLLGINLPREAVTKLFRSLIIFPSLRAIYLLIKAVVRVLFKN